MVFWGLGGGAQSVSSDVFGYSTKAGYRCPDSIKGGTWEAFERIMRRYGYFEGGLRKVEAARAIAEFVDPKRNRSDSFLRFRDAIVEATG